MCGLDWSCTLKKNYNILNVLMDLKFSNILYLFLDFKAGTSFFFAGLCITCKTLEIFEKLVCNISK